MELGKFSSWEIVSETVAIKKTSMSFFKDDAMVIPIEVRPFWGIEGMKYGDSNKPIIIKYAGNSYEASIRAAKAHGATLLGWHKDLAQELKKQQQYEHHYPFMVYERTAEDVFTLTVKEDISENTNDERYDLYDAFQNAFPLETLKDLPLEKYTNLNKDDSFCYWVESKTYALGSIWGGTSYKFGIYRYAQKPNNPTVITADDKYAWYTWYKTNDCKSAYSKALSNVIDIAQAAADGDFMAVEDNKTFGDAYKWKIAFLYSGMSILPIYKRSMLETICSALGYEKANGASIRELQMYMMSKKGDMDFFAFYDHLLTLIPKEEKDSNIGNDTRYWLYAPGENASKWEEFYVNGEMGLGWSALGDYRQYETDEDLVAAIENEYGGGGSHKNDKCAIRDFQNKIKIGDVIIVKQGRHKLLGRGVVQSDYYFDDSKKEYGSRRKVLWTDKGQWDVEDILVMKTLTDISQYPGFPEKLEGIMGINNERVDDGGDDTSPALSVVEIEKYTDEDFLAEVFVSKDALSSMKHLLKRKKNILLQGAPGVGKTFAAKRLAYALMGEKDASRIAFVQFHQNYSYEDFIMGYKPEGDSFELKKGIFYKFCKKAQDCPDKEFFFIIDEINRANLSKVFGELLMLIEKDYRGESAELAYSGELFSVPANLYIIGMMNTADRSLAMIDYALRRRFSFVEMSPCFDSTGFKNYMASLENEKFEALISEIKKLNTAIRQDDSLGKGFEIGHSYFCNLTKDTCSDRVLKEVVKYDIAPTLQEYWFDDEQKAEDWTKALYSVL